MGRPFVVQRRDRGIDQTGMDDCVQVEVIGPARHHAIVVRALEAEGLACRWMQPEQGRNGVEHDDTLLLFATGDSDTAAKVVGQLRLMHPRLRVAVQGDC